MRNSAKMIALLGLAGAAMGVDFDTPRQRPVKKYYSKTLSNSEKDRLNTMKRMKMNAKRKANGLQPLRSLTRFGGYRIPD
jgi:hypothetical protein